MDISDLFVVSPKKCDMLDVMLDLLSISYRIPHNLKYLSYQMFFKEVRDWH